MTKVDLIKAAKSLGIGLLSAAVTLLPQLASSVDLGIWNPLIIALVGVIVNFIQGRILPPTPTVPESK
mgnify:CR=1 FL=1